MPPLPSAALISPGGVEITPQGISVRHLERWLDEQGVQVVGLESTGVYWKPVVLALRKLSPSRLVWLVNPGQVKQVPGRKTDVKDSEWLSKLVLHGLVAPSYLPPAEQAELRQLTRFRATVVGNPRGAARREQDGRPDRQLGARQAARQAPRAEARPRGNLYRGDPVHPAATAGGPVPHRA
jgi:transposase